MRLILASASPRRKELITKISGITVDVIPSNAEEKTTQTNPARYAMELAQIKARSVFNEHGGVVLGADTVVAVDGEILGKPKNAQDAERMLKKLCGRTHSVITGLCVISENGSACDYEETRVTFAPYDKERIGEYIKSGSPFDKAGGYGIQDEAIKAIALAVDGDLDNVIGLPVKKVEEILKQFRR